MDDRTFAPATPSRQDSPQFRDGKFRNAAPMRKHSLGETARIWWTFMFNKPAGTVPRQPIPVRPLSTSALLAAPDRTLYRLGHSTMLIKLGGDFYMTDPVFSKRASPVQWSGPARFHAPPIGIEDLPPIRAVILSHDHYDHLDVPTIEYLRERVERYFVPTGVGERLQEMGVAPARITELGWWQSGKHGDIGLTAAPAQHFSGRTLWDRDRTLWASWIVQSGSQRIFYSGDSGYFAGFKQIGERFGPFDVTLMENGAYDDYWPAVHMSPEESIQAFQDLRGKLLYGVHNTTFDLAFHRWQDPMERLTDLAEAKQLPIATPVIGEVLTVGQARTNVRWWKGLR